MQAQLPRLVKGQDRHQYGLSNFLLPNSLSCNLDRMYVIFHRCATGIQGVAVEERRRDSRNVPASSEKCKRAVYFTAKRVQLSDPGLMKGLSSSGGYRPLFYLFYWLSIDENNHHLL